jgi:TRAP-type C4-dicarboxylate transport system permease small subunit
MSGLKILAIVLIIAGALALAYGGFSYTSETHRAKIGPVDITVKERETVNIPVWAGLGAVLVGVVLLVVGKGK